MAFFYARVCVNILKLKPGLEVIIKEEIAGPAKFKIAQLYTKWYERGTRIY